MQELKVQTAPGTETLTVLEGTAQVIRDPKIIGITGTIKAPLRWMEQRRETIEPLHAHIIINREKLTITMNLEDKNYFGDSITGKAEFHPIFKKFAINNNTYRTPAELAQLFKMNRSFFENQSTAMNLVSELQNFKAKVAIEVEKLDDNRANKRDLQDQVVNSNIPEKFNLKLPIFKGTDPRTIEVEIYIKAEDLTCCLISPEANDLVEELRDRMIDEVLKGMELLAPTIVVIEE